MNWVFVFEPHKLNLDKHFGQSPLQSGTDFSSGALLLLMKSWQHRKLVYELGINIECWVFVFKPHMQPL